MPFSANAKDKYIAPRISEFTSATIKDMAVISAEQDHWLANFILNTMLSVSVDERHRQVLFNFLRRVHLAFREYSLAREQTARYLRSTEAFTAYLAAIGHWEAFLLQAYQAYLLLVCGERVLFKPNDGSVLNRLNVLYNRSKHLEKSINAGQLPTEGTMPVWLADDGLHGTDIRLTFDELAGILEELAWWSDIVQDPSTITEKLLEYRRQKDVVGQGDNSDPNTTND